MGGRGTAFNTGVARGVGRMQTASDARDFSELKQYMQDAHGIHVADGLQRCDFQSVRAAAQGMEDIMKEFPQAAAVMHELTDGEGRKGAYASASFYGNVNLNPEKFRNRYALEASYSSDLFSRFHPRGTTADSVPVHEAGHLLERALIEKHMGGQSAIFKIPEWNRSTYAKSVISEACKLAKKTEAGKGLKNNELIQNVSRYATKNRSETLAECVADYHANRGNAQPLSIAVWQILKRELG